jgi:hypothetical protein
MLIGFSRNPHLYVHGCELAVANGLPLGLSAQEQYGESVFTLGAGEQLTLMTDGVVEARGTSGELLGFDRVQAMTTQPADSIARAAQNYGQDDDITADPAPGNGLRPAPHRIEATSRRPGPASRR